MNKQELDILSVLLQTPYINQRNLSAQAGHSLGVVNNAIKVLSQNGYLDEHKQPTEKAKKLRSKRSPRNAIILAAGFGMRMVPINTQAPKALLEVHGEPLIERMIKQLHQAGIQDIRVVVGFMKEHFEYLIDLYGVELVTNVDYATKNNLHSLNLVLPHLSNTYIIPGDIWCRKNPFIGQELYSWYMVSNTQDRDSSVRVNRRQELIKISGEACGNKMIGIAYLLEKEAAVLQRKVKALCANEANDSAFWEEALFEKDRMTVNAKVVDSEDVVEINTYEQLRDLDSDSNHLQSNAINVIAQTLQVENGEITDITVLKKGMTNRSFLFQCKNKKYIMRIPGEGTDRLINRKEEAAVYQTIANKHICDDIAYINPENGYKITGFLENARVCDPESESDVSACMARLRQIHEMKLQVPHTFDIFKQIDFYESLWEGKPSCFKDYKTTKKNVLSLKAFIDKQEKDWCLTHIDAVPDNFLFVADQETQSLRLIDWEYAGMQDPHVDLAMFCIYAMYDREHVEKLIDTYFPEGCAPAVRAKIYCYISACGLLWSNWCEYKRQLGVEFGEYSLRQYRFAKEYYKIATECIEKLEG